MCKIKSGKYFGKFQGKSLLAEALWAGLGETVKLKLYLRFFEFENVDTKEQQKEWLIRGREAYARATHTSCIQGPAEVAPGVELQLLSLCMTP